ncbi:hypothetical protein WJX84_002432 [Apatococcus fuscideae]|uniref:Right handed beta helix domain-containing protein n=1 Tax=Apatococcus fuscideae TaxID=2026836 RepID=A0AAW1SNY7_9CHLO
MASLQARLDDGRKNRLHRQQYQKPASSEDDDHEPVHHVAWSSGASRPAEAGTLPAASGTATNKTLRNKTQADQFLKSGEPRKAIASYSKAISLSVKEQDITSKLVAALYCNRRGEALFDSKSNVATPFTALLDTISIAAAMDGDVQGFDGRTLEVREAGEEAWLGKAAPEVPELDYPPSNLSSSASSLSPVSSGNELAGQVSGNSVSQLAIAPVSKTSAMLATGWKRSSFRSVKEAVDAAEDGDRILLLSGIHNGMGEAVNVGKRLLIEGSGQLGETKLDQRANSPTFRITRTCVIRNIDIDMTGFREAIFISGSGSVQPLVQHCIVRCSGDDAVNICGDAKPTMDNCLLQGKKCGLRAFGACKPRLGKCRLEDCGEQGLKAMDTAKPFLTLCQLKNNAEEGAVVMDSAVATLAQCRLLGNKGPGIDISSRGRVVAHGCTVSHNVGGLWLWDQAQCQAVNSVIEGGSTYAVLADGIADIKLQGSCIKGMIQATERAWEGIDETTNQIVEGLEAVDLPAENGPFKFVPDQFTRKQ